MYIHKFTENPRTKINKEDFEDLKTCKDYIIYLNKELQNEGTINMTDPDEIADFQYRIIEKALKCTYSPDIIIN